MKDFRMVQLYYRDEDKVMRKVEGLKIIIHRGNPDEVVYYEPDNYTDTREKKILLKNDERTWR